MTLLEGKIGETYVVQKTTLPLQVEKRMEALGMIQGTQIKIIHKKGRGALVILLRGTRFAVGKGIVSSIEIEGASHEK